ncbi:hypothetical protein FRC08_014410 [Ceratobasidium sp. 394]|nr:hypothetical protein FRC08_014410 [Ceratobasidium sp. 394]KAG9102123.1 hypothetical protein FS749_015706 [Ceratobasidium sp. UAMH 11750]
MGSEKTRALRAAVQNHLGADLVAGDGRARLVEAAAECQLLLIVGTSLKLDGLLDLTRELAEQIHLRYGAVVYIHPEPLKGRHTYTHIDFHLASDVLGVVGRITDAMNTTLGSAVGDDDHMEVDADGEEDFWFDIANNEVQRQHLAQEALYEGPACAHCSCTVPEYLAQCGKCATLFCYRRTHDFKADEVQLSPVPADVTNTMPSGESSEEQDNFPLDEACIAFDFYEPIDARPCVEVAKRAFVCPDCWDHKSFGLYPHFVRPAPRLTVERPDQPWPRLAALVYYVEQFWPQARHLCTSLAGIWRSKGWECAIEPVKLEHLGEKTTVFDGLAWEEGSYEMLVIYLTHGLSGDQGYQVTPKMTLRSVELFQYTLPIAQNILSRARCRRSFLVCCAHPLLHSGLVTTLRNWIDRDKAFDSLLGCMNTRLSPAFMVNLLARLSIKLVGQKEWAGPTTFQTWMRDSVACSHSDLLWLAPGAQPELWLYAPFQSRPLGKPLPNLLSVCSCPDYPRQLDHKPATQRPRKIWKVTHNGKPGDKLSDIKVKVQCRLCRQLWVLPTEHLVGRLRQVDGVYGVIVPYFAVSAAD